MNGWGARIPALCPEGSQVPERVGQVAFLLLAGYVLVLPTAGTVALRNALFFSALLLTLFAAVRWKLALRLPFAAAWLAYAAVAMASLVHSIDPAYSVGEIKAEILYGIIATMLAATWVTRTEPVQKLVAVLLSGSVAMALVACWQAVRDSMLGLAYNASRLSALHSGAGDYSTYIVVLMPFLLGMLWYHRGSSRVSLLLGATIALNVVGAAVTRNRAVFPALAVETVVLALLLFRLDRDWLRHRRIGLWIGLFVLGAAALFVFQILLRIDANPVSGPLDRDPRWEIWAVAIDNIRSNPWFGSGFGRGIFASLNPAVVAADGLHWHAHNVWLDKGVQMGVPGIAAFAFLIAAVVWQTWLPREAIRGDQLATTLSACALALIAGLLVKNATDDFFVRDQGYLFWVIVGAIASSLSRLRSLAPAPGPPRSTAGTQYP